MMRTINLMNELEDQEGKLEVHFRDQLSLQYKKEGTGLKKKKKKKKSIRKLRNGWIS